MGLGGWESKGCLRREDGWLTEILFLACPWAFPWACWPGLKVLLEGLDKQLGLLYGWRLRLRHWVMKADLLWLLLLLLLLLLLWQIGVRTGVSSLAVLPVIGSRSRALPSFFFPWPEKVLVRPEFPLHTYEPALYFLSLLK